MLHTPYFIDYMLGHLFYLQSSVSMHMSQHHLHSELRQQPRSAPSTRCLFDGWHPFICRRWKYSATLDDITGQRYIIKVRASTLQKLEGTSTFVWKSTRQSEGWTLYRHSNRFAWKQKQSSMYIKVVPPVYTMNRNERWELSILLFLYILLPFIVPIASQW